MKTWQIDYSVKLKDGTVMETGPGGELLQPSVKAASIVEAVHLAQINIADALKRVSPEVDRVMIWSVTIMEDDVFGDEEYEEE